VNRRAFAAWPLLLALASPLPAQEAKPPDPEKLPAVQAARAKLAAGNADGALSDLEAAAKADPELPPAPVLFARLLFQQRNFLGGRFALEQAARLHPEHPEVHLTFGELAFNEGRFSDAILQYERASRLAGDDRLPLASRRRWLSAAHGGLALVSETRGDWSRASASLRALRSYVPDNPVIQHRLGVALFMEGKDTEATPILLQAIAQDRRMDSADLTIGRLWFRRGDIKKAEERLRAAAAVAPRNAKALAALAELLMSKGGAEEAYQLAAEAVALQPEDPDLRVALALAARQSKDYGRAAVAADAGVKKFPQHAGLAQQLIFALAESPEPAARQRAVALADERMRLTPSAGMLVAQAWAKFRAGDGETAERMFRQAVLAGGADAECVFGLASVLAERGKEDEAKSLLSRVLGATGMFVRRADAQTLQRKLGGGAPAQP
jgi:tetratricopeptide (TPR) repeat protein